MLESHFRWCFSDLVEKENTKIMFKVDTFTFYSSNTLFMPNRNSRGVPPRQIDKHLPCVLKIYLDNTFRHVWGQCWASLKPLLWLRLTRAFWFVTEPLCLSILQSNQAIECWESSSARYRQQDTDGCLPWKWEHEKNCEQIVGKNIKWCTLLHQWTVY